MENIDNNEYYSDAISEICNVASVNKVSTFIKSVIDKFVSNNSFIVNQEMIGCYYSLITEITKYIIIIDLYVCIVVA